MVDLQSAQELLFDAAPHAYLALRADADFEICRVNAKFLAMTGARREDLVGRRLFEVLPDLPIDPSPASGDDLRASLTRVLRQATEDDSGVRQLRVSDGRGGQEIRVLKWINTPIADESGRLSYILCHFEDASPLTRAAALASARPRVVIVQNDPDVLSRLDILLKSEGYDVTPIADATTALAACLDEPPALLLAAAGSQGDVGLELTRRLRAEERTAAMPIMILSARGDEKARIAGYEAGADALLARPFSEEALVARIGGLIRLTGLRASIAGQQRRDAVLVRLASVVETAMDAVISIDESQKITLFNAAAEKMFGCEAARALGRPIEDFIPQRFRAGHSRHVEEFGRTGVSGRSMGRLGDLKALRADGEEFPIEASISQAYVDGERLFTVILRDISERTAAATTQRLLIGELDHRVKNTLAMVQAIANQTAKAYSDPKVFVQSFNGRVRAMSNSHTLLTRAGWKGADLGDLLAEQLTLGTDPRIRLDGGEVFLGPRHAQHFGMVLYELGVNARKYGALSSSEGRLDLSWMVETQSDGPCLAFDWVESGGPPVQPPAEKHFGTRLIESSLTHTLHGKVELDFAPSGLRCRISLPLRQSIA